MGGEVGPGSPSFLSTEGHPKMKLTRSHPESVVTKFSRDLLGVHVGHSYRRNLVCRDVTPVTTEGTPTDGTW